MGGTQISIFASGFVISKTTRGWYVERNIPTSLLMEFYTRILHPRPPSLNPRSYNPYMGVSENRGP